MRRLARPGMVLLYVGLLAGWATPGTSATGTGDVPELAGEPMEACAIHSDVPVSADLTGYCGTLRVPEDRADPAGRWLDLRVVVVPAASEPRADALFAIAGGPGDASTTFFAWLPGVYADVHALRDIVLVDQRGTGASDPLVLPAMPDTSSLLVARGRCSPGSVGPRLPRRPRCRPAVLHLHGRR